MRPDERWADIERYTVLAASESVLMVNMCSYWHGQERQVNICSVNLGTWTWIHIDDAPKKGGAAWPGRRSLRTRRCQRFDAERLDRLQSLVRATGRSYQSFAEKAILEALEVEQAVQAAADAAGVVRAGKCFRPASFALGSEFHRW
jgi:hypothetical protein